jgi:uncharacterized protein (TIGR02246 family)
MKPQRAGLIALTVLLLVGCGGAVDIDAEREVLLETDRAWAQAAAEGTDIERIVSVWTDDAKWWAPGEPLVEGKEALREMVGAMMQIPGFSVSWEALTAEVASGGDMAYTTGRNRFTVPGEDGNLVTVEGRYVAVWRKEADGSWRQAIGMHNN